MIRFLLTIVRPATQGLNLLSQLALSSSHGILPPGQPAPALTNQKVELPLRYQRLQSKSPRRIALLVACLTSQQHASVFWGRICSDKFTCCHTEIEVADQTFDLSQSQYTDTGPTSPSADPVTPGDLKSLVSLDPEKSLSLTPPFWVMIGQCK